MSLIMSVAEYLLSRTRSERGQTFVEYALILAVVVVGVLLAVTCNPGCHRRRHGRDQRRVMTGSQSLRRSQAGALTRICKTTRDEGRAK